jgi:DNA-binding HxlR family transcriptional regulator
MRPAETPPADVRRAETPITETLITETPLDGVRSGAGSGSAPGGVACPEVAGCSVQDVVDRVAGKWSVCILVAAAGGPIRFTELERSIDGISRRMLTLTLRHLERDGMVVRRVYATMPPRVEYSLTPMARELHAALVALTGWAERHQGDVAAARQRYDGRGP